MRKDDLPVGMMGQSPEVIARFRRIVASGESPRLAEMLAVRKGPCLDTDTAHFAGMSMAHLAKSAGPAYADKVATAARKAGINITDSSIYNGTVADERGGADPGAWLLAGDGKAKFQNTIRERGGGCESLGVKHGESQQRMDTEQKRLEKLRWKKKEYKKLQKQVQADMKV